jgi:hypothetical protein
MTPAGDYGGRDRSSDALGTYLSAGGLPDHEQDLVNLGVGEVPK